mmetsp:Transcript_56390/g.67580  ORF Transcript_56390/g.67580 Transcript_56390/m.67580 type:complete len:447 (+) Transcript_56390:81-1421(+)|eukprot:CAMPEP_0172493202 /NCGR_PEP_ID=MMETSP1066-20121228/24576_1 /TAXON_ID=671091 /ORGANISM="Coscinodiscus wailesii, Strain CCMP2513" /LENGTH=446 /DNA_ID=CAMNT_0013263251 /DNA_START=74 /DNA_END=1414 /DNA_ORIENTATION=-
MFSRATTHLARNATRSAVNRSQIATSTGRVASSRLLSTSSDGNNNEILYDAVPKEDFGAYKEYSVIFTNRSLNLMSDPFQKVMRDLNVLLKKTYNADKVVIIPGSGTFGMEAVARQFATDKHAMVIRNGWFSFRWTEIFDMGGENKSIPSSHTVLKAKPVASDDPSCPHTHYAPYPIEEVIAKIESEKPAVLFAPHVETSTGMMLPDDYIRRASAAMHEVGGLFVLDCIASGTVWADMKDLGVDVVISAPQKGWTGPACAALVMMSEAAAKKMLETEETSFSMSLKRWSAIMDAYEGGGFGYHTTMPTDGLRDFHEISVETMKYGMDKLKRDQIRLGDEAHKALGKRGLVPVAAPGYRAPGVLVYYSPEGAENVHMMNLFKENGLQIAMGVPWRIDEPVVPMKTFRLGLFGLDKMGDVEGTVSTLEVALDKVMDKLEEDTEKPKAA